MCRAVPRQWVPWARCARLPRRWILRRRLALWCYRYIRKRAHSLSPSVGLHAHTDRRTDRRTDRQDTNACMPWQTDVETDMVHRLTDADCEGHSLATFFSCPSHALFAPSRHAARNRTQVLAQRHEIQGAFSGFPPKYFQWWHEPSYRWWWWWCRWHHTKHDHRVMITASWAKDLEAII